MTPRGRLIAIEGIDGSGKNTQMRLLEQDLTSRGFAVYSTGFPQYESWFGRMVGQFLNGDLGPLDKVDPHFSALLYAGDRFEAKSKIVTVAEPRSDRARGSIRCVEPCASDGSSAGGETRRFFDMD